MSQDEHVLHQLKQLIVCCLVAGCFLVSGCGTLRSVKAFDAVSAGMSYRDVTQRIGHPLMSRGALMNDRGEKVEVWEYKVGCPKSFEQVVSELSLTAVSGGSAAPILLSSGDTDRYWIYFVNCRYAGWTRAGCWELDIDKIRTMRFDRENMM